MMSAGAGTPLSGCHSPSPLLKVTGVHSSTIRMGSTDERILSEGEMNAGRLKAGRAKVLVLMDLIRIYFFNFFNI